MLSDLFTKKTGDTVSAESLSSSDKNESIEGEGGAVSAMSVQASTVDTANDAQKGKHSWFTSNASRKYAYLLDNQLLTKQSLKRAVSDANLRRAPIESILRGELGISKEAIGESLSRFYGMPFVAYDERMSIPGELLQGMKVSFMRRNLWVPLGLEDETIVIAIDDPNDVQRIDLIRLLYPGKSLIFRVSLEQDILSFIELFTAKDELEEMDSIISQLQEEAEEDEEAASKVDEEDSIVIQLVNKMILHAYERNASDVHVEPYPGRKGTRIRFRVDGRCYLYQTIPHSYKYAVTSRIKIMASLDIAEKRKPQDGKIIFKGKGAKNIELRVSTVPTQGGLEDVVLRILASGDPLPLDKMGFSDSNYANFISVVSRPYGLILVCGPTGSGKTTTLHSALGRINDLETKIWTAEDPVEITQDGLRQVQVLPKIGFDFASALRAFLRSDPDVIMVGEMRDKETAHIGIEASLTGHLVLSTLHTNGAVESIARLLDMGLDPFNFSDAILCILAQRLVLTLCSECKKPYHPSQEQYDELIREYGREEFERHVNTPYSDDVTLYETAGCTACNQTGYKGRMGLHELLMGTDQTKMLIRSKATIEEIRDQTISDGMTTLKQDGIEKILSGKCDLLQVRKVCI
jgi:type II secretory ATPase GspE/PulE/Tfp pilus assembly ATPase PilB-like protein